MRLVFVVWMIGVLMLVLFISAAGRCSDPFRIQESDRGPEDGR